MNLKVIKKDGHLANFDINKMRVAVAKAVCEAKGEAVLSASSLVLVDKTAADAEALIIRAAGGAVAISRDAVHVCVEQALTANDFAAGAAYITYRHDRKKQASSAIDDDVVRNRSAYAAMLAQLDPHPSVNVSVIVERALKEVFVGMTDSDRRASLLMSVRAQIEVNPQATYLAAAIVLGDIYGVVGGGGGKPFAGNLLKGVDAGIFNPELLEFDLDLLAKAIDQSADKRLNLLGVTTLLDRYLTTVDSALIEAPQHLFMRVSMGLALREQSRNERAIEFYQLLSSGRFMNSTPTLFNSGTTHSQLSSCYLTTVADSLVGIYGSITENALLQKFAGGLGNDWTRVRALGAHIKGTNGKSLGVVPYLGVVNATALAVNQGGKRPGAVCAFLETWHLDIQEFLELRKNTGDERRRTHNTNTANWVPDLFMERVKADLPWTLFSPNDVPHLHELYGPQFKVAYEAAEAAAARGEIKLYQTVQAITLWRKMLQMVFETGHPWITFKDPCNMRSPQQHVGVVHSSNLCTEITLNTSDDEIAVCNLGSVNLFAHLVPDSYGVPTLDAEAIAKTVKTAMRMLDNVIDINFYAVDKAKQSNLKHRPVGLGVMGVHDALQAMGIAYGSEEAVEFCDRSQELICWHAYDQSSELAAERGPYQSFNGSLWSKGILPCDSWASFADYRGTGGVPHGGVMDWDVLRAKILRQGMRNSNCVAIAPTATIANIVGCSAGIDPIFENVYVKSNASGEFTVVNPSLQTYLESTGHWNALTLADLKHYEGSLQLMNVPEQAKRIYATAFEIEPHWLIRCAAARGKWIDQAQSLNLYLAGASGKKLDDMYRLAYEKGLKTTYYLRTRGATSAEKSTGRESGQLNAVSTGTLTAKFGENVQAVVAVQAVEEMGAVCSLRPGDQDFASCESCQ